MLHNKAGKYALLKLKNAIYKNGKIEYIKAQKIKIYESGKNAIYESGKINYIKVGKLRYVAIKDCLHQCCFSRFEGSL